MTTAPHDDPDLLLGSVLLALDGRLEELGELDPKALSYRIALEGDQPDHDVELRIAGVLASVGHLLDRHGWELSWHDRGIRVEQNAHFVVLGIPDVIADFVADRPRR